MAAGDINMQEDIPVLDAKLGIRQYPKLVFV